MICEGCGEPLNTGSRRGRPARYHNATCRQRARRARLAADHHATLVTLAALEASARDLRHALLTHQDTGPAHSRIAHAVADLAQHLNSDTDTPAPDTGTSDVGTPVTEHVTISRTPEPAATITSRSPEPHTPQHTATTRQTDSVATRTAHTGVVKTVDLGEQIAPGWTLIQYEGDADAALWHVQHDGRTVGTVVHRVHNLATNKRGWEARTSRYEHVRAVSTFAASRRDDSLWRTRNSAAAGIAAHTMKSRTRRAHR